jgi:O-antigen/teichoic acid export membrane protein
LVNTFSNVHPLLQGSGEYKKSAQLHTAQVVFGSSLIILGLFFTKNIILLISIYYTSQLISNIIGHLIFTKKDSRTPRFIFDRYLKYAKNTSLRNIATSVAQRIDNIILFTQLGAVELAIYSVATVIPEQIKSTFKNLATLLLPKYAKVEKIADAKKNVPLRTLQLFIVLTFITVFYIIFSPFLYGFLFPNYPEAVLYSQIAALAFPTFILFIPYSILQSQLAEKELYKITLFGSLFLIISLLILVFFFGIIGAIIAKLLYRLYLALMSFFFLYKKKIS